MRALTRVLTLAVLAATTIIAKADTFTLIGAGNDYTFSINSPITTTDLGFGFTVADVPLQNNGVADGTTTITFYDTAQGGGLGLLTGVFFDGPQLYTQSGNTFTFNTGDFTLTNGLNADQTYSLVISGDAPAVPEPASIALFSTGALAAAAAMRRKLFNL
jgi:hypothetical protein